MSRETKWARVARLATDGMRFDAQTEPAEQIAARIHQIGGGRRLSALSVSVPLNRIEAGQLSDSRRRNSLQ